MDKAKFTIEKMSSAPNIKLVAAGYIAFDTAGQFEMELNNSFKENPQSIMIDMEEVVIFTSVAIRVLLKAYKTAEEMNVVFKIVNPSRIVRNVLKLSQLEEMLVTNT